MKCPKCDEELKQSLADKRFYFCDKCNEFFSKRGLGTVEKKEDVAKEEDN